MAQQYVGACVLLKIATRVAIASIAVRASRVCGTIRPVDRQNETLVD